MALSVYFEDFSRDIFVEYITDLNSAEQFESKIPFTIQEIRGLENREEIVLLNSIKRLPYDANAFIECAQKNNLNLFLLSNTEKKTNIVNKIIGENNFPFTFPFIFG